MRREGWVFGAIGRAGAILTAWVLLLAGEHIAVGIGYRALFVGTWEMGAARKFVTPIVLAALVPLAVLAYFAAVLACRATFQQRAQRACAAMGAAASMMVAIGVSNGRHMASLAVRVPFVLVVGALGFVLVHVAAPRLARLGAARPGLLAGLGAALAVLFWTADTLVLPRLYPAFHLGLFGLTLACSALLAPGLWSLWGRRAGVGIAVFGLAVLSALATPWAARGLTSADNLRIVLLDHAPLMGRAVLLAAAIVPPPEESDEEAGVGTTTAAKVGPGEVPRALDWSGRDIVLLSVDALRADRVGAYGYNRPTTPNIDRLAAEGVLFEWAYCPTPHTSYSITSMMTGKYMRPLLLVGLGEDSETWAKLLRQYGHLTAAFYPPAVFFIDTPRFVAFQSTGLDFEYRRVEFSSADERAEQVSRYLEKGAQPSRPLFLWVHLFEPHEPYVMHPAHPFGANNATSAPTDRDRYDSEVAAADAGIGKIVARVREKRPNAIVMLTADHGEEFGEHGGRYHGTTVYEEQVHVPLIVAGGGAPAGKRVSTVVQTIDLLPTTLSALGIPRPARIRGRDLGALIAGGKSKPDPDPGLAFAETDDFTLVAKGDDRLVCARKASACTLYEPRSDPRQERDRSAVRPTVMKELRQLTRAIAREHGQLERGDAQGWPDALRRGSQGDADAAEDVAALLDDVRLDVRRKAAEVLFDLRAPASHAALQRALAKSDDPDVRRGCALALVRLGEAPSPTAEEALRDATWKRRAALALGERGDARGASELIAWWREGFATEKGAGGEGRAKEILYALGVLRDRGATGPLVRSLNDVRLRPFIADTLAKIGDPSAKGPLLAALASERYVPTRPHLARALLALGARDELRAPLQRFAGIPEPMPEALPLAYDARILDEAHGGWSGRAAPQVQISLTRPHTRAPLRLLVLLEAPSTVEGTVGGAPVSATGSEGLLRILELGAFPLGGRLEVALGSHGGIRALWLVPRSEEIEPPPPEPWDAGVDPTLPGQ